MTYLQSLRRNSGECSPRDALPRLPENQWALNHKKPFIIISMFLSILPGEGTSLGDPRPRRYTGDLPRGVRAAWAQGVLGIGV